MMNKMTPPEATLPKGVKDFLPVKAAKVDYLRRTLQAIFNAWGFRPVIPPSLEFLPVLERGLGADLRAKAIRFDDRQSGELVVFTPDITPQVARIVATRMVGVPLPLRLCYDGRVLRHEQEQQGKDREVFQTGVELYGVGSAEADAEMIAMVVECLQALGVDDFSIDVGQVEFSRGIMEQVDLPAAQMRALATAISRKDSAGLRQLLDATTLPPALRDEILLLPRLFGGPEVLDRAAAAVRNRRSQAAITNLRQVVEVLAVYGVGDHVTFDLGELCGLDYHTGVTFDAYLPGVGQTVCSGGRYDNLTAAFGEAIPATGFTFNLLNLLFALDRRLDTLALRHTDVLIAQAGANKEQAQRIAQALRRRGYSAARDMVQRDQQASIDYAQKMNYRYLMNIGADGCSITLLDLANNSERALDAAAIFSDHFEI
jgi:ATP phosphoribosyltransferase regulatory subunit